MPQMRSYVALGSNVAFNGLTGPSLIAAALGAMESRALAIERISRCWTTPAWPNPAEPAFTNAVAAVASDLGDPLALLAVLLDVEREFGRIRGRRNAPRTLDLDLLDVDGQVYRHPKLTLPHPRLAERAFVLAPLCDIAPGWRHPQTGETASALLAKLDLAGAVAD